MRLTCRAAGLLALAVVAITCTDTPTGPGAHRPGFSGARLAMAPSFSPAASRAYGALEAMGIVVTQVRIRLRTADGTVARDTTIQYGAEDILHVQISVEIQGTEQTFSALIELMDASGTVLFSQAQDVTARASSLPAAPPPTITLEYVGPGATARVITVTPSDVTVQPGVEPVLTAVGTDAAGSPVTDLLLAWTSSDAALATVTAVGRVATVHGTGRRGTVTITATAPTGLAGSARLAMLPLAAGLAVISGDAQTSVAGRLLAQPLVVELQGVDGGPIPDATVTFRAVSAGASVGLATATTDAAGRASTTLTLGRTAGTYAFEAASGVVPPVTISATATPTPATALALVSGDAQVDSIGTALALPLVVRATDEFGAAVSGASITWERLSGLGTLGATTTTTDASGLASTTYLLGLVPSAHTLRATITGASDAAASVRFTSTSIARGPHVIAITSGGGQSGLPGTTLAAPLVALVIDTLGNRLTGVSVQWESSIAGLVAFAAPVAVTDASGEARTAVTLGTVAGMTTVTARVGTLAASTTIGVTVGAAARFGLIQPAPASVTVGVAPSTPVVVRLDDANGNAVNTAGVIVTGTLTVPPSTEPAWVVSAPTDDAGIATLALPAYSGAIGSAVLTITASGLSPSVSNPIAIVAGAPALVRVIAPPALPTPVALSGLPLAASPVVQVTDVGGNPLPAAGISVSVGIGSGVATLLTALPVVTDASGQATFNGLIITGAAGPVSLLFSAPSLASASLQLDLTPDPTVTASLGFDPSTPPPTTVRSGIVMGPLKLQLLGVDGLPVRRAGDVVTATVAVDPDFVSDAAPLRAPDALRAAIQQASGRTPPIPPSGSPTATRSAIRTPRSGALQPGTLQPRAMQTPEQPPVAPVLLGSVTAVTDVNGVATFDALAVAGTRDFTPYLQLSFTTPNVPTPAVLQRVALLGGNPKEVVALDDGNAAVTGELARYLPYARVLDSLGNGVDGLAVTFAAVGTTNGTVTNYPPEYQISSNGYAFFESWQLPPGQKTDSALVTVAGLEGPYYVTVWALKPSYLTITPLEQTTFVNGSGGTPIPLNVVVLDSLKTWIVAIDNVPIHATSDSLGVETELALGGYIDSYTFLGYASWAGYPLTFNTNVGEHRIRVRTGDGYTAFAIAPDSTGPLNVVAAPPTGLAIQPINGTEFSVVVPAVSQAISANVFDAENQPVVGAQLILEIPVSGSCTFAGGALTLIVPTNASGLAEFSVDLSPLAARNGGGCTIWARSGIGGLPQSPLTELTYRIALAPSSQHYVWWGDDTQTGSEWALAANWRGPSYPSLPTDKVFVPAWYIISQSLTLNADLEIGEITVEYGAQAIVNAGRTLRVRSAVTGSPGGIFGPGRIMTTGSGTLVTNVSLSNLVIGESTGCAGAAPVFAILSGSVYTESLTANCRSVVAGSTYVGGALVTAVGGRVELTTPASQLYTAGNADFGSDSLIVSDGFLTVVGTATFAASGSFSGGYVQLEGDATFGRSGGTGGYALTGGVLQVGGNLTQARSDTASTFVASGAHLTMFSGTLSQRVTFEDANASHFATVRFANFGAGVLVPSGLFATAIVAADVQPNALLTIDGTFSGPVPLKLFGGAKLTVNGLLASGCSGRDASPAPVVTGTGFIDPDRQAAVRTSCSP